MAERRQSRARDGIAPGNSRRAGRAWLAALALALACGGAAAQEGQPAAQPPAATAQPPAAAPDPAPPAVAAPAVPAAPALQAAPGLPATQAPAAASPSPAPPSLASPAPDAGAPPEASADSAEGAGLPGAPALPGAPGLPGAPALPEAPGLPGAAALPGAPLAAGPVAEATLPHDLSPWGMFMAADSVVKGVMIGLAFASVVTWTVFIAKALELLAASSRLRGGLRVVAGAPDLDSAGRALAGRGGSAAAMVRAAIEEADVSAEAIAREGGGAGVLARVGSRLSRIEAQAGRRLAVGTGVLATIGATAPFVGLFGTVWGIMNSFIGISETQTTNLAVVAPGIAEALLATALGLVAAIPAVVIYNLFARWIAACKSRLADVAAGVERLVSRDLDHRRLTFAPLAQAAE